MKSVKKFFCVGLKDETTLVSFNCSFNFDESLFSSIFYFI